MKHAQTFQPTVVVQVHGSCDASFLRSKILGGDPVKGGAPSSGSGSRHYRGDQSGDLSGAGAVTTSGGIDPYAIAVEWPDRWSTYLRAAFRTPRDVARAFDISERTAGVWWDGLTGCKAQHLVVALKRDPERAADMLLD